MRPDRQVPCCTFEIFQPEQGPLHLVRYETKGVQRSVQGGQFRACIAVGVVVVNKGEDFKHGLNIPPGRSGKERNWPENSDFIPFQNHPSRCCFALSCGSTDCGFWHSLNDWETESGAQALKKATRQARHQAIELEPHQLRLQLRRLQPGAGLHRLQPHRIKTECRQQLLIIAKNALSPF